ncbi:ComF family protein [Saliterribacillus persicus]|uniref:Competence protein ComFC n=1 Tax=Saliterribacillus persicus TaxID=930114 RepID=A0A368Y3H3_9BACI|nr:ComF family protein [Saliterribacillus persicus]RCW74732.1 competence protein ComFC [Saliterribacillus persicus]
MSHCLICYERIVPQVTWTNLLLPVKEAIICSECKEKLPILAAPLCEGCGREMTEEGFCADCLKWQQDPQWKRVPITNHSVYPFQPFMREVITTWKYRGDYQLIECFQEELLHAFETFFYKKEESLTLVPIPLSNDRLIERAFNQAEALALLINKNIQVEVVHALTRKSEEASKQSKMTRKKRLARDNPFTIKKQQSKPVILIDDIYTTGMTIRHATKILLESGCPKVTSFTLAR